MKNSIRHSRLAVLAMIPLLLIAAARLSNLSLNSKNNLVLENYILSGIDLKTDQGRLPYRVAAIYNKATNGYCSAVIISKTIIATAAHCVDVRNKASDIEVRFGLSVHSGYESRFAERVIVHNGFQSRNSVYQPISEESLTYDIALVILSDTIPANASQVSYILKDTTGLSQDDRFLIVGYGISEREKPATFGLARYELLPGAYVLSPQQFVLFRNGSVGACQGDSGGPAYKLIEMNGKKTIALAGILSAGGVTSDSCESATYISSTLLLQLLKQNNLNY